MAWELSGVPLNAGYITHGHVLRQFVLARPKASHYLFLHSDVQFLKRDTVPRLLADLESRPDCFAAQARLSPDGMTLPCGGAWSPAEFGVVVHTKSLSRYDRPPADAEMRSAPAYEVFRSPYRGRCHPACALVRNTPAFRAVAKDVGFSIATVVGDADRCDGAHDTFGLACQVMRTHGYAWCLASPVVLHFGGGSYLDRLGHEWKLDECRRRLAALRGAVGT